MGQEKTITSDQLDEIAQRVDGTVNDSYSGRGMYGSKCIGVTTNKSAALVGAALVVVLGDDLGWKMAKATSTDSMGRQTIVYWPGWTLVEGDEIEDDLTNLAEEHGDR